MDQNTLITAVTTALTSVKGDVVSGLSAVIPGAVAVWAVPWVVQRMMSAFSKIASRS